MRSERLRWLVKAEGPFASVYFDDSHDTADAIEQLEAKWRDIRKHLEHQGADGHVIGKLEEAVLHHRPAVGRRGRAVIATSEQVLVNEHLISPPPATVVRLSDYPYIVPLIDMEMQRPTYVFAAVDHGGADITLYQGEHHQFHQHRGRRVPGAQAGHCRLERLRRLPAHDRGSHPHELPGGRRPPDATGGRSGSRGGVRVRRGSFAHRCDCRIAGAREQAGVTTTCRGAQERYRRGRDPRTHGRRVRSAPPQRDDRDR